MTTDHEQLCESEEAMPELKPTVDQRQIGKEKCGCGRCNDWWLTGIGKFVRGSGFTEAEANEIIARFETTTLSEQARTIAELRARLEPPENGAIFTIRVVVSRHPNELNTVQSTTATHLKTGPKADALLIWSAIQEAVAHENAEFERCRAKHSRARTTLAAGDEG